MKEISISVLLWLSSFLGISEFPREPSAWTIQQKWVANAEENFVTILKAKASDLPCSDSTAQIVFPSILHAAQTISVDGKNVAFFGDPQMKWMRSFYGSPLVDCRLLSGEEVSWTITASSRYFARINKWPQGVHSPNPFPQGEILLVASAGALIILGLYLIWLTNRTVLIKLTSTLGIFAITSGLFFVFSTAGLFGISISMKEAHRWADFFLGMGSVGFVVFLYLRGLINKVILRFGVASSVATQIIILLADSSDEIQLGTTLSLLMAGVVMSSAVTNQIRQFPSPTKPVWLENFLGLAIFVGSSIADILYTVGLHSEGMSLPFGFVGCAYLFAIALQTEIKKTYHERDYLRKNLEKEVQITTRQLRENEADLRKTLADLKQTQGELIQSAKMASLGTLSAGIAHEINNSLNFVNGALPPLKKLSAGLQTNEEKQKFSRLMDALQDGVRLTLEIVKSLRNYSGLNQASRKEIFLAEVFGSVLTILKGRMRPEIKIETQIPTDLKLNGNIAGLSQVFMNLISNGIDAIRGPGLINIEAAQSGPNVEIKISDSGGGIPPKVLERIWDPFFTTKDVGKGTGLGLYIVQNEIKRHEGKIQVITEVGKGTTFVITLPSEEPVSKEQAA